MDSFFGSVGDLTDDIFDEIFTPSNKKAGHTLL